MSQRPIIVSTQPEIETTGIVQKIETAPEYTIPEVTRMVQRYKQIPRRKPRPDGPPVEEVVRKERKVKANSIKAEIYVPKTDLRFGWFRPSTGGMTLERFQQLYNSSVQGVSVGVRQAMAKLNRYSLINDPRITPENFESVRRQFIKEQMDIVDDAKSVKALFGHPNGRYAKVNNTIFFVGDPTGILQINSIEYDRPYGGGRVQAVKSSSSIRSLSDRAIDHDFGPLVGKHEENKQNLYIVRLPHSVDYSTLPDTVNIRVPLTAAEFAGIYNRMKERDRGQLIRLQMRIMQYARMNDKSVEDAYATINDRLKEQNREELMDMIYRICKRYELRDDGTFESKFEYFKDLTGYGGNIKFNNDQSRANAEARQRAADARRQRAEAERLRKQRAERQRKRNEEEAERQRKEREAEAERLRKEREAEAERRRKRNEEEKSAADEADRKRKEEQRRKQKEKRKKDFEKREKARREAEEKEQEAKANAWKLEVPRNNETIQNPAKFYKNPLRQFAEDTGIIWVDRVPELMEFEYHIVKGDGWCAHRAVNFLVNRFGGESDSLLETVTKLMNLPAATTNTYYIMWNENNGKLEMDEIPLDVNAAQVKEEQDRVRKLSINPTGKGGGWAEEDTIKLYAHIYGVVIWVFRTSDQKWQVFGKKENIDRSIFMINQNQVHYDSLIPVTNDYMNGFDKAKAAWDTYMTEKMSMDSMPQAHLFEKESFESGMNGGPIASGGGASYSAPTVEALSEFSLPNSHMFESESSFGGSAAYNDDVSSIVNSVISGDGMAEHYSGVSEFKGVQMPVTNTDVNLASLINDQDLWEASSAESGYNGAFDITDADMDQFEWELSSTEM